MFNGCKRKYRLKWKRNPFTGWVTIKVPNMAEASVMIQYAKEKNEMMEFENLKGRHGLS